jgi:transposase InsO family protein
MDDHGRFIVGYGLHASQSTALVLEVLRAALTSYGVPQEILTDNGTQYVTWRGKSAFTKELEKRGIKQVVAAPRRPQTLGKIERFWGTPVARVRRKRRLRRPRRCATTDRFVH